MDPITMSSQALAAAQNSEDPEMAVIYLAVARNALSEAKEHCRQLEIVIGAREKEIGRLKKLAEKKELGT